MDPDSTDRRQSMDGVIQRLGNVKISIGSIIDAIGDPLSIQDTDFRIVYQNDVHKKFVGGDYTGELCYKAYSSRDDVCPSCPVAMTFQDGCIHTVEKPGAASKGILSVEITASALRDHSGKLVAGIEVIRDLTRRKETELELQRAEANQKKIEAESQKLQRLESLSVFAGNIAHEYNNILTAIIGNLALAKMYAKPGYEVYDVLIEAERASHRAKDLTAHLLSFAKGGSPLRKIMTVQELFNEVIPETGLVAENVFEAFITDDIWPVEVDEAQIAQALGMLIKLSEQRGCYITADNVVIGDNSALPLKNGRYVAIKVLIRSKVSNSLLQSIIDPTVIPLLNIGSLGLHNLFSILKKNNGHIALEETSESASRFNIFLPASHESHVNISEKQLSGRSKKGKILVMDDEEIVRVVINRLLLQCGFEAELVSEGSEMLRAYREAKMNGAPYVAVLLDLIIQNGMGGKEAMQHLLDYDPQAIVIVSSGYSNDPLMVNFREYGFAGYLPKPYRIEELKRVLNDVLARYEQV